MGNRAEDVVEGEGIDEDPDDGIDGDFYPHLLPPADLLIAPLQRLLGNEGRGDGVDQSRGVPGGGVDFAWNGATLWALLT